ncbi:MAG: methyltransferase [Rikenellaceae bacterium]|nr:methyltransferase [Rikenellaceae bacterium]
MSNDYFRFKRFCIQQGRSAMKVGTDGVLIGAWCSIPDGTKQVLDIGCGSGLISIMLAQRTEQTKAYVKAIDIDPESVAQAIENVGTSDWPERVSVECVSLQEYSKRDEQLFDLIVSNPPFFVDSLKAPDKARNNSRHCDTLSHEELLRCSSKLLAEGGVLAVVLPSAEAQRLVELSAVYGMYPSRICSVKSTERKDEIRRLVELVKSSTWHECRNTSLCIHAGSDYSEEYKALTKDFYLKF